MLCYVMLCHVMSCHVKSCYVMLCYVICYMLYVMLCYVMLCSVIMLCHVGILSVNAFGRHDAKLFEQQLAMCSCGSTRGSDLPVSLELF